MGIQGRIIARAGKLQIWAGKPLFDGSQAVLVFNGGPEPATAAIKPSDLGFSATAALYVRDLWQHVTLNAALSDDGSLSVAVGPNDVRFFRISKSKDFPLPPIIVADTYLLSFRTTGAGPQTLTGTVALTNKGSEELPLWKVRENLPAWLAVSVVKNGRTQTIANTVTTAGLKTGLTHAVVRLDNIEPLSGKPMSAVYYDVDLEVAADAERQRTPDRLP